MDNLTNTNASIAGSTFPLETECENLIAPEEGELANGLALEKGTPFGTMLIAMVASTFIAPVIAHEHEKIETLIQVEEHTWQYPDRGLTNAAQRFHGYNNVQNEVDEYLSENPGLERFLDEIPAPLFKEEGIKTLDLELYHDYDEHWEKLFVVVNTDIIDMQELERLQKRLVMKFIEPRAEALAGRVILSVG